jgi:hypothetical protein
MRKYSEHDGPGKRMLLLFAQQIAQLLQILICFNLALRFSFIFFYLDNMHLINLYMLI